MIFRSPWPDIPAPGETMCDVVLASAKLYGEKVALIEGETGRTVTYAQLVARGERVAAGLAHAGLAHGEPVAVVLPNSIEFVLAWLGALLAGGWVVPINPAYMPAEMEMQIRDAGARICITCAECAKALEGVVEKLFATGANFDELLENRAPRPDVRIQPDDLATMPYSSGTTGKPKGVRLTHANLVTNIRQLDVVGWVRHDDVMVVIFPLYHVGGLNCMLTVFFAAGATLVLTRRFELQKFLELSAKYGATFFGGPPPVVLRLTQSESSADAAFRHMQWGICGAAPLGAEAHQAFEKRTGALLGQVWGMSEATAVISATPRDRARRKLGSCGHLLPSVEAQVVNTDSLEPLGVGQTGEIWLRGPNITKGYWNQPQANAATFTSDGWMRTGDIGYVDSDQHIFLIDRLKELIKYNALQVAPAELEDIILTHPEVLDVAVVGAPDAAAGEIPLAYVVRKAGAGVCAEDIMQFVSGRVAAYKKVRAVEFIAEIPKSPSGKILRRILKEKARSTPR